MQSGLEPKPGGFMSSPLLATVVFVLGLVLVAVLVLGVLFMVGATTSEPGFYVPEGSPSPTRTG